MIAATDARAASVFARSVIASAILVGAALFAEAYVRDRGTANGEFAHWQIV